LAHQFKTPLTVIRTASSGLPAAGGFCEEQTELVSLIDQEARKLSDLASRLVGAPMLESAEFQPQPEPLLLSRLMRSALQEIEPGSDRDRFRFSLPAHEPPVFADRELILTALVQLVDNALKYSMPGSAIDVELKANDTSVILSVRSEGLVLSTADRERIFERFYRAPGAQDRSSGTGLGLSIVKTIAAGEHGHVWAEGEPGYGTVFWFSLPVFHSSCQKGIFL
jgi:two-component system sensor histidine kinase KdpD